MQRLGLEGGQPGSEQHPHSGCPRLLLPPSGLSPTRSPGSGPGRGRVPGGLGLFLGSWDPVCPELRPRGEISAPKETAAGAHRVQQRAVGGAQRSLPEDRVPELRGPRAPGSQAAPGRTQSAGPSPPPRAAPPPARGGGGDREARGARAAQVPQQARGVPAVDPGLGPVPLNPGLDHPANRIRPA